MHNRRRAPQVPVAYASSLPVADPLAYLQMIPNYEWATNSAVRAISMFNRFPMFCYSYLEKTEHRTEEVPEVFQNALLSVKLDTN